jgi:NAD(P)-dependent dehydrogenase (short-subunit alcohol dehydrogenase family)
VVNDVSAERADEVVAEVQAVGGRAAASYDSVADPAGANAIVQTAVEHFGTVDAIVNNAGTMRNGWFEELSFEDLQAMFAVHVGGCFLVTQAAWPILREKGYGRVVMVGSAGGMWSMQYLSNYAAAKGGVYGLGRALAFEGREHGIAVNVLLPGATTTISGGPIPDYEKHFRAELAAAIAPRRVAEAVAPIVSYLCSSACSVTGETFSAVAGRFARVLVGVTQGWMADDPQAITAEDVADHFEEICDASSYVLPTNLFEEYETLAERLGVAPRG